MKLNDCECGGTPHITSNIEGKNLYSISCPVCGNSTTGYDDLRSAQLAWNTWCYKLRFRNAEDVTV
jgi:hypothetical protein